MSLTAIPNQPIAFDDTRLMGCLCDDPTEALLALPTDTLTFQVEYEGCLSGQLLGSPNFEDPADWRGIGWSIATGAACNSSTDTFLSDNSFNPTPGNVYTLVFTVSTVTAGYGGVIFINFGGVSFTSPAAIGTYTYTITATGTGPLEFAAPSVVVGFCLSNAQLYEFAPDFTVELLNPDDSVAETFDYASNPERFDFDGEHLTVSIPLSDIDPAVGCYRIRITNGCDDSQLTSQLVNINDHACTIQVTACNNGNNIGFNDFQPTMRLLAKLVRSNFTYNIGEERWSNGYINRYYADRRRNMELRIERLGEYGHNFVSTLPLYDHVYLDGAEYVVSAEGYEPAYNDVWDSTAGIILKVEPKQELARKVLCGEDDGGCAPPPNYLVQFTGPNSDYVLQSENGDRILLNS